METKRVIIKSNGNQAPYGVGEYMADFPAAHTKKIKDFLSQYYNRPSMFCSVCGERLYFDYNGFLDGCGCK